VLNLTDALPINAAAEESQAPLPKAGTVLNKADATSWKWKLLPLLQGAPTHSTALTYW